MVKLDNEVMNEIMFNIQNSITENVDERQLLNLVNEEADCYRLMVYGYDLRFNKEDGSLIS